ncbi:putative E3 ubiquitin-protein ligase XBAT35 isoform X2 [Cornus florida]|uniref:putative E3 ubiquitin-protein ligase XBAT35 isoform X2 n=1 Tax=Cornus florida TaxID=4283 RepID=UPI00289D9F59|nr:putative E3 ubiquitin-protein ligase XBAT35 isoform X2 [Cornus florida]
MGQQQSKGELLYQQVNYGNTEGIKALCREGASLEWVDREGKTPLIVACMNLQLYNVAKTLIELGANVNAYRPGRHAGTPLHHAAKRGHEQTVKLLLSHGANALLMNDDCQTPLDVARVQGYTNVVRAIESHICLFSGWLRELYGPGFLEVLAPQLLSRKVWAVVLPCGSRNLTKPFKLELAIYSSSQDAQPRTIIALWKANLEEPKFNQPDPAVITWDNSSKTRIKLLPENERDKQLLQRFCNACKGIPQVVHPTYPFNTQAPLVPPTVPPTAPHTAEDVELAMAISASLQSANSGVSASTSSSNSVNIIGQSGWSAPEGPAPSKGSSNGWGIQESVPSGNSTQHVQTQSDISAVVQTTHEASTSASASASVPSAPPIANIAADAVLDNGPVQYPPIDSSPVNLSYPSVENLPAGADEVQDGCVICLDAPVEGACVPCGHMAGCMSCLNTIKEKKTGCPVCRAKINQIIRLYAV